MVYLIGAGPGDAGLLTLRALELLRAADVVIYDRLADDAILNFCAGARKIYAGKSAGNHTLKQSEINQLLVTEARRGGIVVRLKGGDPFLFGRGGEEALVLRENNLPFEIVPGVTSAIAVPPTPEFPSHIAALQRVSPSSRGTKTLPSPNRQSAGTNSQQPSTR